MRIPLSGEVLAVKALGYGLGALTSVLVARVLGPHDRGLWAVALFVSGLIALAADAGLSSAGLFRLRSEPLRRDGIVTATLLLGAGSACLVSVLALLASRLPGVRAYVPLPTGLWAAACATALATVVTLNARQLLVGLDDVRAQNLSTASQAVITLAGLALALYVLGVRAHGAIVTQALCAAAVTLGTVAALSRRHAIAFAWSPGLVRPLLSYGAVAYVASLSLYLAFRFDTLLVSRFLGIREAGLYSVALTLSEVLRGIPETAQIVVLSRSGRADLVSFARRTATWAVGLTAAAGAIMAIAAPPFVSAVFGAAYAPSAAAFRWLVPGVVALAASYALSPVLMLSGAVRVSAFAGTAAFGAMVAIDVVLIPRYGLRGAAAGSSCAYVLLAAIQLLALTASRGLVAPEPART